MPIRVACPSCSAVVSAPDTKAGKVVNCPKCMGKMSLPGGAGEYEVVDEPVPKRVPGKPPRFADDEDGDRPRKRKKKAEPAKSSGWLIVIAVLLGLILILGFAALVWLFWPVKPERKPAPAPVPVKAEPEKPKFIWSEFAAPDGSFVAAFPNGAPQSNPVPDMALPNIGGLGDAKKASDLGIEIGQWSRTDGNGIFTVQYYAMPLIIMNTMQPDRATRDLKPGKQADGSEVVVAEATTVGGYPGRRVVQKNGDRLLETRTVLVKSRLFSVTVRTTADSDPAITQAFFDRFVVKNVPEAKSLPGLEGLGAGSLDDLIKQALPPEPGQKKNP